MDSKKNKSSKASESSFLNQLADEFGLEKVLDSLCKSKPSKKMISTLVSKSLKTHVIIINLLLCYAK